MTTFSLIPIRRLLFFFILIQSISLYKIYASDDDRSDILSNSLLAPFNEEIDQTVPNKNNGYDDDDDDDVVFDNNNDDNKDNLAPWLSLASQAKEENKSLWKRSAFLFKRRPSNNLPERRNNRPHWNPLVAAYKRCGELSTGNERESCFKDAIQMLFVHKLRK